MLLSNYLVISATPTLFVYIHNISTLNTYFIVVLKFQILPLKIGGLKQFFKFSGFSHHHEHQHHQDEYSIFKCIFSYISKVPNRASPRYK